jgi:aminoglycoside phosphotransferase (APT) family kinase protein
MTEMRDRIRRALDSSLGNGRMTSIEQRGHRTWLVWTGDESTRFVLKLYDINSSSFLRECKALEALSRLDADFAIPEIVQFGTLEEVGKNFLLMSEIDGRTLNSIVLKSPKVQHNAMLMVGHLLSSIHRLDMGRPQSREDVFIEQIASTCIDHIRILQSIHKNDIAALAAVVLHWLENKPMRGANVVFCHGDLHFRNILLSRKKGVDAEAIGVVDWESVRWAPIEFDIAKSMVTTCFSARESECRDLILNGYEAHGLSADAISAFAAFHSIDGWVFGGLVEGRDSALWEERLHRFAIGIDSRINC